MVLRKLLKYFPRKIRNFLLKFLDLPERVDVQKKEIEDIKLLLVKQAYDSSINIQKKEPNLNKRELKIYSQHGEDGIILYIFSQIGMKNGTFVEFGIEDGRECNTANLSVNFGWNGLLMEIDPRYVKQAQAYYTDLLKDRASDVKIIECKVTMENINQVLVENEMEGEIDLLSIDIDGNDYWVWKAINVINPRLVVIEYNATFMPFSS